MPSTLRACRAASGHTYLLLDGGTLRSLGAVTHRLGRAARVAGPETIRLRPDGGAQSTLLGQGTWSRAGWAARIAFRGAEVILPCEAVGDSGPAAAAPQG